MKGQVSTELLVVVGLVLLIFIPLLVLVYMKANDANEQIASYQSELAVSRLASLANSVGSLGTNTSVTTDVFIPPNTVALGTKQAGRGSEIFIRVTTPQGDNEIAEIVKYPLKDYDPELADATASGRWMRVRISSEPKEGGDAVVKIEKIG